MVILGILAAIALPAFPSRTSRPRLEAYALEAAALLKSDRTAAILGHKEVETIVDAPSRTIRSASGGRVVRVPDDVVMEATLASRCNQRPVQGTIHYFPSGMSCGGTIALLRQGYGFRIQVNWLTGGVEVEAVN